MEDNKTVTEQNTEQNVEKTYSQAELESAISTAVNNAVKKAKEKASKTTDERVAELEAEIARRDNLDLTRKSMREAGIHESLEPLFTGENYEEKIKVFNEWYASAIDSAVKDKISSSTPIHLANSDVKATSKPKTLAERQAMFDNR